ncbi:DUF6287 domain-containing protein [Candidatus Enterococcus mansonii]|uniref:DUF6287 domain-containing protein n=1 Tax=Candidatus Enterococcus mansonii TaxID=1834181 RepID=A0A242CC25_9ENTE|nr:DUF6287 domain-containing protein [Enterococcus sp. 4G2_DIV0659]OTO07761.1 hypothetical protein A5880_002031 [Enterococcus sp. 4G2_DIV0659]
MKKVKRTLLLSLCMVLSGALIGCNKPAKSTTNTDRSLSNTKVTSSSKETKASTTEQSSTVQNTKETDKSEEEVKEEPTAEVAPVEMNLSQIQQGDYSSLNGAWGNGLGQTIFVENNTIKFTDISNQKQPAEIMGLSVDIPTLNSPDGTPELVSYMGENNKVKSYEQQLTLEENQGFIALKSNLPSAAIYVSFLPKGIMGDLLEGDISKDKIVAVGTQNTGTAVRADYVYYKIE